MKIRIPLLGLAVVALLAFILPDAAKWYKIPAQQLDLEAYIGLPSSVGKQNQPAIELSEFITYGEYKEYLMYLKTIKDKVAYFNALPDKSIATPEIYNAYMNSKVYDKHPVVGITWQSAMGYCKWRTKQENGNGKLKFVIRLPKASEWIATLAYLEENKKEHDLNNKFADWTLNSSRPSLGSEFVLKQTEADAYLYQLPESSHVALGNSFFTGHENLNNCLEDVNYTGGYKHISFRVVKQPIKTEAEVQGLLKFWGIGNE